MLLCYNHGMSVARTNEAWITALRGDPDPQALEDLRAALVRGLGFALRKHLGRTDHPLVEDFVQEALVKILRNLDSFRGESRFLTWAQKIAVREAFSAMRRKAWQDVALEDLTPHADENPDFTPSALTDPRPLPEQQAEQHALLAEVMHIIQEELSERQRQAMMAVVVNGMPIEEVARRMHTNRNALYKLLHDARKRLKRRLLERGLSPQDVLAAFEST